MAGPITLTEKDWDSIDAILLDMDGTLLDLRFDNQFWQQAVPEIYATSNGITLQESLSVLEEHYHKHHGTLNWYCTDFWSETLGLDIIKHKYEHAHRIDFRPGTIDFLERVQRSEKDVILVTNAHPNTLKVKVEQTGINRYFDKLYTSHQFNEPKESARFWTLLEQDMQVPLQRCLFVDDTESILIQAQQSGVKFVAMVSQPDMSKPARESISLPNVNRLTEIFESL